MATCNCGREWAGLNQAHCTVCHEHFSTVNNFDKHRRTGTCQYPGTVTDRNGDPVLKPSANRFGVIWIGAGEHPRADKSDETAA